MELFVGILNYLVFFSITATIYAFLVLGLNLQWGYTGLFNVGVAGLFAVGAYTSALLCGPPPSSMDWRIVGGLQLPFGVGVIGAAVLAGLVGALVSIPALRLKEDYLAIATVGIAEVIRLIAKQESWLTNGVWGINNISSPLYGLINETLRNFNQAHPNLPGWLRDLIGGGYNWFYLLLTGAALFCAYLIVKRLAHAPWGRVLTAIREDEKVTAMAGKNVPWYKLQSMILGSMLMGVGGSFYAHFAMSVGPSDFKPLLGTFLVWIMLIVGGSGNNKGAILGALVVWGIWAGSDFLVGQLPLSDSRIAAVRIICIGILLEILLIYRPAGLLGEKRFTSHLIEE